MPDGDVDDAGDGVDDDDVHDGVDDNDVHDDDDDDAIDRNPPVRLFRARQPQLSSQACRLLLGLARLNQHFILSL